MYSTVCRCNKYLVMSIVLCTRPVMYSIIRIYHINSVIPLLINIVYSRLRFVTRPITLTDTVVVVGHTGRRHRGWRAVGCRAAHTTRGCDWAVEAGRP